MGSIEKELLGELYQEALKEIVKKKFDVPLEMCKILINAGSSKGDNYIGVVYRVEIKPPKGKELDVIIKLPPTNAARRENFNVRPCFIRETEFYDNIYPMFQKFQEEKGIDEKDGFYQVAACYKTLTEESSEGLFLEDLKVTGFEMFDRLKEITVDHVNRVMESLGKLHALSFAIKDQKPELIDQFRKMKDVFFQGDENAKRTLNTMFDTLKVQAADSINGITNGKLKQKVHKILENDMFSIIGASVDGASAEPHAVISHGDCWNNNIMYRHENGIPVEIRLLDWQIMRYGSPATDLIYHIFGCTNKTLRRKHYKEFLDVYYHSLSNFLTRLGSNPFKVFPREVLDDHLKRFGKYGLVMIILVLPIFTSKGDDIPDMDEVSEKMKVANDGGTKLEENAMKFTGSKSIKEYNERMSGVFEDMYDLKYI